MDNEFRFFPAHDGVDENMNSNDQVKILVLGETGVGKSTWINGVANYLSFSSMEAAEVSEPVFAIPASFHSTDENYTEHIISVGSDVNEVHEEGASATQHPKTYLIKRKNILRSICPIDTPGVGDTRGIEKDAENFKNIMKHIGNMDKLHGICILLKPNNARLNVVFEYCIKELLANLHKDACRNIVFCFTNCRGTFYRPGDTMPALRKLLEENKIPIELNRETVYCMDNEAVRFLAAIKSEIKYTKRQRQEFSESWKRSADETERLIRHFTYLEPHLVKMTLSVNKLRLVTSALARPLAEISASTQTNIAAIELVVERQSKTMSHLDDDVLKKTINAPVETHLQAIKFECPIEVCTAEKCVEYVQTGNITSFLYKCISDKNIISHQTLSTSENEFLCKQCGCSIELHKTMKHKLSKVESKGADVIVCDLANNEAEGRKVAENYFKDLKNQIRELKTEQELIISASSTFACFMKWNTTTLYNEFEIGLSQLIKLEKDRAEVGNQQIISSLETILKEYETNFCSIDSKMKEDQRYLQEFTIKYFIDELYKMKHTGKLLQEIVPISEDTNADEFKQDKMVVVQIPRKYKANYVLYGTIGVIGFGLICLRLSQPDTDVSAIKPDNDLTSFVEMLPENLIIDVATKCSESNLSNWLDSNLLHIYKCFDNLVSY